MAAALPWLLAAWLLAATAPCGRAWAAGTAGAREKQLQEDYKQCVQACAKPVFRQGDEDTVWKDNVKAEARYDRCVQQCDRALLKEKKR